MAQITETNKNAHKLKQTEIQKYDTTISCLSRYTVKVNNLILYYKHLLNGLK